MIDEIYEALRMDESVFIDDITPTEVEAFMNMDPNADLADQLNILETAARKLRSELKTINSIADDWDYADDIYQFKRNFYNKYVDFARKCREMSGLGGVSGYGIGDSVKLKMKDIARWVDYNFPYGWKPRVNESVNEDWHQLNDPISKLHKEKEQLSYELESLYDLHNNITDNHRVREIKKRIKEINRELDDFYDDPITKEVDSF